MDLCSQLQLLECTTSLHLQNQTTNNTGSGQLDRRDLYLSQSEWEKTSKYSVHR
jgi:hypothetical protein